MLKSQKKVQFQFGALWRHSVDQIRKVQWRKPIE